MMFNNAMNAYRKVLQDTFPTKSIELELAVLEPADKAKANSFGIRIKGGKFDGKNWMFAAENEAGELT